MKAKKYIFNPDEEIEMVAVNKKTGKAFLKVLKYKDALNVPRKPLFNYYFFQKGFSQFQIK